MEEENPLVLYSILRYVPDTIKGEFVNIGFVIIDDDTGRCEGEVIKTERAEKFDYVDLLDDIIRRGEEFIKEVVKQENKEEFLTERYVDFNNMFQITPPTPALANMKETRKFIKSEYIEK